MVSRLQAKVQAMNAANKFAADLHATLSATFAPFVGLPIIKADGQLFAKVQKAIPTLPSTVSLSVYRDARSNYSVRYVVKTCVCYGDHNCIYHEVVVYVGSLDGTTLKELTPYQPLRTDWTEEEVLQGRERIKAARSALDDAESAIYPFGEYDK